MINAANPAIIHKIKIIKNKEINIIALTDKVLSAIPFVVSFDILSGFLGQSKISPDNNLLTQ